MTKPPSRDMVAKIVADVLLHQTEASFVVLHPLHVAEFMPDRFRVTRWGRTKAIGVNQMGLRAIHDLQHGRPLRVVANSSGAAPTTKESAALVELLMQLIGINAVHTLHGRRVSTRNDLQLGELARFFRLTYGRTVLRRMAYQYCPKRLTRRMLFWSEHLALYDQMGKKSRMAVGRMQVIMPELRLLSPKRLERRYYNELVRSIATYLHVSVLKPGPVRRVFDNDWKFSSLDSLLEALSAGHGAILAGFHFSAVSLLPIALMARGLDIIMIHSLGASFDDADFARKVDVLQASEFGFGTCRAVRGMNHSILREVMTALKDGRIVIWMPDVEPSSPSETTVPESVSGATSAKAFFPQAAAPSSLPRAHYDLAMPDHLLVMNNWVGTLSAVTGAPVFTAAVTRRKGWRYHFHLSGPFDARHNALTAIEHARWINDQVFGEFRRLLHAYPLQWYGWDRVIAKSRVTSSSPGYVQGDMGFGIRG